MPSVVEQYIEKLNSKKEITKTTFAEQQVSEAHASKIFDIDLMINEALKSNNQQVMLENERKNDLTYHKRIMKKHFYNEKTLLKKRISNQFNVDSDTHGYLFESAIQSKKSGLFAKRQGANNYTFGWDVFNDDSLYRAYNKRTKKMEDELKNNPELYNELTDEQKLERMAEDIEEQIAKRGQFSRRRMFIEEKDVDYINDRNRKFNEKLERNYSRYAAEIKGNLERGTAL